MRLDRFLAKTLYQSRNDVKKLIRNKNIFVNGVAIITDGFHVDTSIDEVTYNGTVLIYEEFVYYLINKPAGYVCANEDKVNPTIIEYADEFVSHQVHSVGRLDKDTTGALLLTNDGRLTHKLISPTHQVPKVYLVTTDLPINSALIPQFAAGFSVSDEYVTLPALLEIIEENKALVTIIEGKYHQVKRMFAQFGLLVLALHRVSFAGISLEDLPVGHYRRLTKEELSKLIKD